MSSYNAGRIGGRFAFKILVIPLDPVPMHFLPPLNLAGATIVARPAEIIYSGILGAEAGFTNIKRPDKICSGH